LNGLANTESKSINPTTIRTKPGQNQDKKMILTQLSLLSLVLLMLSACASGPRFDTKQVDPTITPRSATAKLPTVSEQSVLWGGVILSTRNLENRTQIEILAYPLNNNQKPERNSDPLGRFILERYGFLEPTSYAEGRMVTAIGKVERTVNGKVGGSDYNYPVLQASNLHLWSRDDEESGWSNIHFGVGVGIGF
jgi:outer membrane lipoprotein